MMTFRDIFADEQTIRLLADGSAVLMLVVALAAVWLCRPVSEKRSPAASQFRGGRV